MIRALTTKSPAKTKILFSNSNYYYQSKIHFYQAFFSNVFVQFATMYHVFYVKQSNWLINTELNTLLSYGIGWQRNSVGLYCSSSEMLCWNDDENKKPKQNNELKVIKKCLILKPNLLRLWLEFDKLRNLIIFSIASWEYFAIFVHFLCIFSKSKFVMLFQCSVVSGSNRWHQLDAMTIVFF